jgi:zinc and cadmium transporter
MLFLLSILLTLSCSEVPAEPTAAVTASRVANVDEPPASAASESAERPPVETADSAASLPSGMSGSVAASLAESGRNRPAAALTTAWTESLLAGYCLLIVLASLLGGMLPNRFPLSHTSMQTIISFVGGLMLGIALFHLLPDSTRHLPAVNKATQWMMFGIITMFILIRAFHFHHHGPLEISTSQEVACELHSEPAESTHAHHDHPHDDDTCVTADVQEQGLPHCHHAHQLSWVGIATGLSLHTLLDGIALAASVAAESHHAAWMSLFGLGTFLAILLHKPLDAVSIASLMAAAGWSSNARNLVNAGFALMCPAGAVLFLIGIRGVPGWQTYIVGAALAFSAGVFICISLSDLLPEMEFHAHNRLRLSLALAVGIGLAWLLTLLELGHQH